MTMSENLITTDTNQLFSIKSNVSFCNTSMLYTSSGLYISETSLDLEKDINIQALNDLAIADSDYKDFIINLYSSNLFQNLVNVICNIEISILRSSLYEHDKYFVMHGLFNREVVFHSYKNRIFIPQCLNLKSLRITKRVDKCPHGVVVNFIHNGTIHTGILTQDNIVLKYEKFGPNYPNCYGSSVHFINNGQYKVVRSGNDVKLTKLSDVRINRNIDIFNFNLSHLNFLHDSDITDSNINDKINDLFDHTKDMNTNDIISDYRIRVEKLENQLDMLFNTAWKYVSNTIKATIMMAMLMATLLFIFKFGPIMAIFYTLFKRNNPVVNTNNVNDEKPINQDENIELSVFNPIHNVENQSSVLTTTNELVDDKRIHLQRLSTLFPHIEDYSNPQQNESYHPLLATSPGKSKLEDKFLKPEGPLVVR
jgi:hypothetical protein